MTRAIVGVAMITAFGMLACKSHDQLVVDTICPQICRCQDPEFPEDCEQFCRFDFEPEAVSQECFDCFLEAEQEEARCDEVSRCVQTCGQTSSPPIDAPDFSIDAPVPF